MCALPISQNYGARKYERIRSGVRYGLLIQYLYCIAAWTAIFLAKGSLVALVLGETASPAAQGALEYLSRISVLFAIHGSLTIFRNTLQGMGHSFQAILSGIGELLGRSLGAALAFTSLGFTAICYGNPISWSFALAYCVLMVWMHLRRLA